VTWTQRDVKALRQAISRALDNHLTEPLGRFERRSPSAEEVLRCAMYREAWRVLGIRPHEWRDAEHLAEGSEEA
jgi:hypothetical protein